MSGIDTLFEAVKVGDLSRVRAIVDATPALASVRLPSGESPVMAALYRGHHEMITVLLNAGAEIDVFTAAATGRTDDLRLELKDAGAANGYSYDGWTPLHLAAFFGHLDATGVLLDAGATVSAVSRNSLTNTPIHAATAGLHGDVALLLIERGAEVAAVDAGGHTPLHIAAENGLLPVVAALLARGADPFAVDKEDKTPLSRATSKNRHEVVDLINRPR